MSQSELRYVVDKILATRMRTSNEKDYWTQMFVDLVENHAIPLELMELIPINIDIALKTKFDQLFEACMFIAFPRYVKGTINKLIADETEIENTKIWRVNFPARFGIAHVLIRAETYQQAFARACDYACRIHLRIFKKIPQDLTIKVTFMTEKAIRRHLKIRGANTLNKRKKLNLIGREYTALEIYGARNAALGTPKFPDYSIIKYIEMKDQKKLRKLGRIKVSAVEQESFVKRRPISHD